MKTKLNGFLTLLLALAVQFTFAQEKTVTGIVSDASGPLPGVTVIVKGTNTGTQTDFDGNYSITADTGAVLVYSYVGMQSVERTVGASNVINVVMEESAEALEEVVVTALGIKRDKRSLGFAQQSVSGDELVKSRQTDISNALAGKVAGVQFLGAPSSGFGNSVIRLRGNTNVLFIVDGIKVESSSDISTDDIADMSVLKGAAATALYGPQGINGVIIITTKQAESGQSTVEINHSTAIENLYLLPEYQDEYAGGYSSYYGDVNYMPTFSFDPSQHPADWASFDGQTMIEYYADESWGPKMEGQMVRHWDSWIPGGAEFGKLRALTPQPDNVRNFFDTGITNNTSLTFSKGGDDYKIRMSLANIDRTSIIPNSARNTTQGTINASLDITDKLTAYANINYQDRRTKNFSDNGYGNLGANFNQWWQRQLDMDRLEDYKRNGEFVSWNINSPTNLQPLYWDMPHVEVYENLNFQNKNSTYGKFGLNYEINDDLNASVEARKSINSYEYNDRYAWGALGKPDYTEDESTSNTDELFGILNYQKQINEDFDVSASVGFEIASYAYKRLYASAVGGLTTENFYSLNTSVDKPNVFSTKRESKRQSVFSKVSVGYKGLLYLDGSARFDWSSTANPEDNRVETYGGSLSFIFSKVLPQNDILSFGKLRASFAQAPRFPGIHDIAETYDVGTSYGTHGTLSTKSRYPNATLIGGVREEMEIGTELKFFQNRLGLDLTYFEKTDKELPSNISLDGATGYTSTKGNEGEQFYKGLEIGINAVPFKTEDFQWNLYLNFATLNRWVNYIAEGIDTNVLSYGYWGIELREEVGDEWGAIYGGAFKRDDQGRIILSDTGSPRRDNYQYLGNIIPKFTGGFSNNFRYKNFNLGFDIDFQKGGKYFSVTKMFNNAAGLGIETVGNNPLGNPVRDNISGSGDAYYTPASGADANSGGMYIEGVDETTGEPAAYYVNATDYWWSHFRLHEKFLYDASYVKLRTIRIDYSFSKELLERTPFTDVNVGVFGNNVWMIYSDVAGIDPSEIETFGGIPWFESGQLPNVRTFGLNVKLTF